MACVYVCVQCLQTRLTFPFKTSLHAILSILFLASPFFPDQTSQCSVSVSHIHASFFQRPVGGRGNNNRVAMRRQVKCVGLLSLLLLLLAALSPVVVVAAAARRELPLMAASIGDNQGRQDVMSSSSGAANGEAVETNSRRFRSRRRSWKQMPAASSPKFNFGGRRIPFTADYHSVHRHPPSHN